MKITNIKILGLLTILITSVFYANITNAKDYSSDLFSIKANKYRYYSSPEGSAYVKQLPKGYKHFTVKNINPINPSNAKIGEVFKFQTIEAITLSDFLTLPSSTIIEGKAVIVKKPRKLIKDTKIIIEFDKATAPNGFEIPLSKDTFEVQPLVAKSGSRYEFEKETWYGIVFGGAKYPVSRFLNTPVSIAIWGGGGLLGGIFYGHLTEEYKKMTILGTLRGLSGKFIYSFTTISGNKFEIEPGKDLLLTLNLNNIDKMEFMPQYLNINQLMVASSLTNDKNIDEELVARGQLNKNSSEVIDYFKTKANNDKQDIDNQINLGKAYISSGRYQKAIIHFKTIAKSFSDNGEVYFNLAEAQNNSGLLLDAKTNYEKAVELRYSNKEIYLKLAEICKKMGNFKEAGNYFDKYNNLTLAIK